MSARCVSVHVALQTIQLRLEGSRLLLTRHDDTKHSALFEGRLETLRNICDGTRGHSVGGLSVAVVCACVSGLLTAVEAAAERQAAEIQRVTSQLPPPMVITVSFLDGSGSLLPSPFGPCVSALHAAVMALLALCDPRQLLGVEQLMRGLHRLCDPDDGSLSLGLACAAARFALGFALSVARFTAASFDCRSERAYHYHVMPGMNGVLAVMGGATACRAMQRLMRSRLYCVNDLVFLATIMLSSSELSGLAANRETVNSLDLGSLGEIIYLVFDLAFAVCTGVPPLQAREDMQTAIVPWIQSHADHPTASILLSLPEDVMHQWLVGLVDEDALLARAAVGAGVTRRSAATTIPASSSSTLSQKDRVLRAQTPAPGRRSARTDDDDSSSSSSDDEQDTVSVVLRDAAAPAVDVRKRACDHTGGDQQPTKRMRASAMVPTTTIAVSRPQTLLGMERSSVTIPAVTACTLVSFDQRASGDSASTPTAEPEEGHQPLTLDALRERHRRQARARSAVVGVTTSTLHVVPPPAEQRAAGNTPRNGVSWRTPLHDTVFIRPND